MASESTLWQKIKTQATQLCHHIERIDALNIPDIHILRKDLLTIWVETKYVRHRDFPKKPKTTTSLGLKKEQGTWHYMYNRHKGTSYILVYIEHLAEYWLFQGSQGSILGSKAPISTLELMSKQYKSLKDVLEVIL